MKKISIFILSTSITVIAAFGFFKSRSSYIETNATEIKTPAATSYLRVTEGNGGITQSSYPQIIPSEHTSSKVNRGVYDPRNRTLTLDVQDRRIDLKLKESLVDNKPIIFVGKYVGKFSDEAPRFSYTFNKIKQNLRINCPIKIEGTLEKKQNQINVQFTATSHFDWWGGKPPDQGIPREGNGSVTGKLTLKMESGQQSDLLPEPEWPVCYY